MNQRDMLKSALIALFFMVLALFAYFVVYAGLRMELERCSDNLDHVINRYNTECWSAVIDGPIPHEMEEVMNETNKDNKGR